MREKSWTKTEGSVRREETVSEAMMNDASRRVDRLS